MEGELPPEDAIYLAVVGARRFTTYGKEACEKIIGGLNNKTRQFVIVSGLAIGIDGIAHKAALKSGLKTIAIGLGLDDKVLHPSSNRKLSKEIVERGGCLISELDWEMPARYAYLPFSQQNYRRNVPCRFSDRSRRKSGTLITADLATIQPGCFRRARFHLFSKFNRHQST